MVLDKKTPRKIRDLLGVFGIRQAQIPVAEHNILLLNAERTAEESGKLVRVTNSVLQPRKYSNYFVGFDNVPLGTKTFARNAIIESSLELDKNQTYSSRSKGEQETKLPFVRIFSLDHKQYCYVDIRDIQTYEFDNDAMKWLVLPPKITGMLTNIFHTPTELLMGDIIKGKHGGLVILACGDTGVGKTLTAEVYAEVTNRPLYVLEMSELGTKVDIVEKNLSVIFARVAKWNAVLLFDEVDIFLRTRDSDLERSAIVGVFLRLMDYYRGVMFLTTNIPDVLDFALKSRVTIRIDYPKLDNDSKQKIWANLFKQASINYTGSYDILVKQPLNGRQIRNAVRLTKIMHPSSPSVDDKDMVEVLSFSCVSS